MFIYNYTYFYLYGGETEYPYYSLILQHVLLFHTFTVTTFGVIQRNPRTGPAPPVEALGANRGS